MSPVEKAALNCPFGIDVIPDLICSATLAAVNNDNPINAVRNGTPSRLFQARIKSSGNKSGKTKNHINNWTSRGIFLKIST